ncbi:4-hydroxy-tetrahydrodipicolinate reductase [Neolewinella antarctica]|uniref:4-hydroxy-tetrahydrodipicolinate reductase n=1 Tax=Neolewinella antarctica TaxID=442734 RepID=A0ABX0X5U9_9BACT|nr:4-hydroxy-tetrahydrodipicolinate reductase [Neolewinella antarctica]NJC24586.1 4-hydroxy-tetrahydrodipicolinate reductase [Neolewinella antarctica]
MKIALLGYGRMGRVIESLAIAAGDEIVLKIDAANRETVTKADLATADVAIEFSRPEAAVDNIKFALAAGVPVVVGTTGWLAQLSVVTALTQERGGAVFHASNFSVGVNVFFAAAQQLGKLLAEFGGYSPEIEEIHHLQKLESPSGTAITLAGRFAKESADYSGWRLAGVTSPVPQQTIAPATAPAANKIPVPIIAVRSADVPGTHVLTLTSDVDTIELTHTAHSREGFAKGALVAARWIIGKHGVFTMEDLLKL